jgi:tetratricopeptide (TPR) repeat protein
MIPASISLLDQEELIRLAINSSQANDAGMALVYLKEATSRADATATAHYLLGVEYAQIQMYPRAIAELESATTLDPSLSIARFQLGLLLMSSGDVPRAISILQSLGELEQQNPLHQFGIGLVHLMHDEFFEALHHLNLGIESNTTNPPLNVDMQKLVDEINKLPEDSIKPKSKEIPRDESGAQFLLTAYSGNLHN